MDYKAKIWIRLAVGDKHDFGCLMLDFPDKIVNECMDWAKENIKSRRF